MKDKEIANIKAVSKLIAIHEQLYQIAHDEELTVLYRATDQIERAMGILTARAKGVRNIAK